MRIVIFSIIFLGFSLPLFAQQSSDSIKEVDQAELKVCLDSPKRIQVATYNLLNRHTWRSQWLNTYPPWEQRMKFIALWVKKNNLDILGTQEGLFEMLSRLKDDLPDYEVVGKPRSEHKKEAEYSAIFINQKRYEILRSGDFWLSKTPDVPASRSWDSRYPRLCTWVELKDKTDNSRIFAFNAHYDHLGFYSRIQSTKIILDRVKEIAGKEKVILMGDFNTEVDSSALDLYSQYFSEARSSSRSQPKGHTRSFYFGIIDHIYLSPSLKTCSYEIMEPKSPDNKQLSDHWPVVVGIDP